MNIADKVGYTLKLYCNSGNLRRGTAELCLDVCNLGTL